MMSVEEVSCGWPPSHPGRLTAKRATHGFTLMELLIVVAVVGLLAALIVPSIARAVESGKSAGCVSRLRAIGTAFMAYQAENQNLVPGDDASFGLPENITWISALRDYCDINSVRSCPAAPKPGGADLDNGGGNKWGSWKNAWGLGAGSWMLPAGDAGYSSYGMNMWARRGFQDSAAVERERASLGSTRVSEASKIPLIMDARWEGIWPVDTDPVPSSGALKDGKKEIPMTGANWRMVDNLAMLRHGSGINICFLDGSVRPVPVNDLWTLKWNKNYEPLGPLNLH